jgi:hypothetical protein
LFYPVTSLPFLLPDFTHEGLLRWNSQSLIFIRA